MTSRAGKLASVLAAVHDHILGAVPARLSWRETASLADVTGVGAGCLRGVAERHPLLAAHLHGTGDVDQISADRFAHGLRALLDGLAARP